MNGTRMPMDGGPSGVAQPSERDSTFATVEEALQELRDGKILIVIDDEDRENEGDLIVAAEMVTPEIINFLATHARGLICMPMLASRLAELELAPMVGTNTAVMETGFTVSVDYVYGTTTGISASDRHATVKAMIEAKTRPEDLARPGHLFPLIAQEGGVLRRNGHTEATVDLARLAGLYPAGILCEVTNKDGEMARLPDLQKIAREWDLKILTISDLVEYRRRTERLVTRELETTLPTRFGEFNLHLYRDLVDDTHHVALTVGDVTADAPVLTRVHSQCFTGDVLGSVRCDCGAQLDASLAALQREGRGALVYLHQEGRGIGLVNKLKAYALQDEGLDTVEANLKLGFRADEREYSMAAQVLSDLGVTRCRLLTNNPNKQHDLERFGVEVVERVPMTIEATESNRRYLAVKREKLGHFIDYAEGLASPNGHGS